jgi:protein-disulfide isomerase
MRLLTLLALMLPVALAAPAPAQQQARRAQPAWVDVVVRTPEGGYRQGNPNARVKLVEYGSRTCPTCGRFAAEATAQLRSEWIATGKLSYEFRDYLIHGAPDFALALLNQCVPANRFFTVLDWMFAHQQRFDGPLHQLMERSPRQVEAWQALPPAQSATRFAEALGMIAFMKERGLAEAQARRCLSDPRLIRGIAEVNAGAEPLGVQGTPTFFVNGRRVRANSWDRLQPELRAAEG